MGSASFEPLHQPDMYDRMMRMQGQLRSVHLAMTRPEHLDRDRGAFGNLVPEVWGPKVPSINVQLGVGRHGPKDRYLDRETEETVFNIAEHASDFVDRLIVRGRDSRTNKIEELASLMSVFRWKLVFRPTQAHRKFLTSCKLSRRSTGRIKNLRYKAALSQQSRLR